MKKRVPPPDANDCVERLQAAADALAGEGVHQTNITAALLQVALRAVKKSRDPAKALDLAAKIFLDAAHRGFEKAKQDRAEKRARRLGLTDDD